MAEHILMQKGAATMNVPAEKVKAYLANGWIEIGRQAIKAEVVHHKPPIIKSRPIAAADSSAEVEED